MIVTGEFLFTKYILCKYLHPISWVNNNTRLNVRQVEIYKILLVYLLLGQNYKNRFLGLVPNK